MKTLCILIGFAAGYLLIGCAHQIKSRTTSNPAPAPTTIGLVTNTGAPPLSYQWQMLETRTITNQDETLLVIRTNQ